MQWPTRELSGVVVAAVLALAGPTAAATAFAAPAASAAMVPSAAEALRTPGRSAPRAVTLSELPVGLVLDGEDGSSWQVADDAQRAGAPEPRAPTLGQHPTVPVAGRSTLLRAGFLARRPRAPPARSD